MTFCSGLKVVPLFVPKIKAMTELCLPLALPYNCLIIPYLRNRPAFFNYVFWFLGEHENKDFPIIKYGWNIIHRRVVDLNNNSHETEKYWTIMLRTWIHSKIRRSSRKGKRAPEKIVTPQNIISMFMTLSYWGSPGQQTHSITILPDGISYR